MKAVFVLVLSCKKTLLSLSAKGFEHFDLFTMCSAKSRRQDLFGLFIITWLIASMLAISVYYCEVHPTQIQIPKKTQLGWFVLRAYHVCDPSENVSQTFAGES